MEEKLIEEIIQSNENNESNVMNKKRYRDTTSYIYIDDLNNGLKKKLFRDNTECPYLGTIKRHLLDFDFEKVCSISLSNMNVYACLTCGRYYQGRGTNTLAYTHSLEEDHHMFINLNDQKIYCLPDNYEVIDNSLNDIKFNLKPKFGKSDIESLDKNSKFIHCKALDGSEYIPGCIGLNNIKKTDYVNVIIQALSRVPSLRNFFLQYEDKTTDIVSSYNFLF
jgi:U4/U6.U5 tri-snRNP-associated protein 2